jgi:hypothetical protein
MVFDVVIKMMKKIKKEHPNMPQPECMSKAWKTKEVAEARKKYDEWKAKQTKKGGRVAKKPVKKVAKKVVARKPAKKPVKKTAAKKK